MIEDFLYWVSKKWDKVYYPVRNLLFPGNVVQLKALDRSWQETDVKMEECLFQLLKEFFNGQQHFHVVTGIPYERDSTLTTDRHRVLLDVAMGPAEQALLQQRIDECSDPSDLQSLRDSLEHAQECFPIYTELLNIVDWYDTVYKVVDEQTIFVAVSRSSGSFEDALKASLQFKAALNERLLFIVKNRKLLWT